MKKILSPMEKLNFPESEELPEGVREIEAEDTFGYCTELYPDVEYAEHSGKKLHLQIMTPTVFGQDLKWPLIVYVQGSSWHKQKPSHTGEDVRKRICDRHRRAQRKRAGSISGTGNRRQNSNSFLAFKWTEISY